MKAKLVVILAVLALIGIGFTALAVGGGPRGRRGAGGGLNGLNDLNLTSEQQQSILTIRQEFQKDTLTLRQELQKKQLEMQQLWEAKTLNQAALEAKSKEIIALEIQWVTKTRAMQEKVKKVLTSEQLKQWGSRGDGKGLELGGPARHGGFPGFGMGF